MIRLSFVHITDRFLRCCSGCGGKLQARKVHVKWIRANNPAIADYMLTDVLHCTLCKTGFIYSAFQNVLDVNNVRWRANTEKEAVVQKTDEKVEKKAPCLSNQTPKKQKKKNHKYFEERDDTYIKRTRPIVTNGSPRSQTKSSVYNSAGVFTPSRASKEYENYWGG